LSSPFTTNKFHLHIDSTRDFTQRHIACTERDDSLNEAQWRHRSKSIVMRRSISSLRMRITRRAPPPAMSATQY
jgi:hypothetical protein